MLEPVHRFRDWLQEPKVKRRTLLGGIVAAAGLGGGIALAVERYGDREKSLDDLPGGKLTILSGQDESDGRQREALVSQWNQLHPSHEAVWKSLPSNTDLQYNGIHAALQSQDHQYDLVNLDIPWITEFAGHGYLRPLDGIQGDAFLTAPFRTGLVDGKVYALPFNTDVGLLYYRKDVLKSVPPEWGWDELIQANRELLADASTLSAVPSLEDGGGIAMQLADYEGFTVNVWEMLLSKGVDPIGDDPTRVEFDQAAVAALEGLQDLIDDNTVLHESLEYDEAASLKAFKDGRSICLRHWPNAYRQLVACGVVDFEVGVARLPGTGVLGGQSLAVTSVSRHPVAAQALAEFLTNARSQQLLFERGGFAPTRPEPYEDAFQREAPSADPTEEASESPTETASDAPADADSADDEESDPCVDPDEIAGFPLAGVYALKTGVDQAGRRPAVDRYNRFSEVFRNAVHGAFVDSAEIDFDQLETDLEQAVEGK